MIEKMELRNNNSIGTPKNAAKYDKRLVCTHHGITCGSTPLCAS